MFKIKQKTKKIFSTIFIVSLLFLQTLPLRVMALTIPDSLFNSISASTPPITNSASNQGSSANKIQGPKVDVTFSSSGLMQQGAKITATAIPSYFNDASDPKNLYFTWYLKRSGCENKKDVSEDASLKAKCDFDGDDKITENDWKIAATKIIIKGPFDSSLVNYNNISVDESLAGYKATPSPKASDDEWVINSGEDSNSFDAPNCYIQEPISGLIYEMRRVKQIFNDCPNDALGNTYHRACVSTQKVVTCDVLNPEYTQENIDVRQTEIDAINAWNTDPANADDSKYPKIVPNQITKTIPNDFSACAVSSEGVDSEMECQINNPEDLKNFKASLECRDGKTSLCVKDTGYTKFPINGGLDVGNPLQGIVFGKNDFLNSITDSVKKNDMCSVLAKPNESLGILAPPPNFLDNTHPAIPVSDLECGSVKNKLVNGTKDSAGNILIAGNSGYDPTCSFEKDANMCKHLFPDIPGAVTGDGKFTLAEKQFWGADPTKASTNGTQKDEEAIIGLGVDKFSWLFSPGDMVGVVVEGESIFSTEHADASFKRMWAFSNNTCSALEKIDDFDLAGSGNNENKRGFYIEGSGVNKTGFLSAEIDLNDCLEENLLDPDVGNSSALTVQLNASPQNPTNDSSGNGDILNITSFATNMQNSSGLLYSWSVQKSRDGSSAPIDTTGWLDITSAMENGGSFSSEDAVGINKRDLAINLNLQEDLIKGGMNTNMYNGGVFYIRVKVKIKGTAADGSQDAEGVVVVRINQQENEIHVYPVTAANTGMLSLNKGSGGESLELCTNQQEKMRCFVTKNQIIGIEVPNAVGGNNKLSNFSWSINGNPASCSAAISSQCVTGGNVLFIPILGNVGEAVNVVAKAINEKNESVEVSRYFVIGETGLQITSAESYSVCDVNCLDNNNLCPKYLGKYILPNGSEIPDCSMQVWETNAGASVKIGSTGQTGFDWAIDGQIIPEYKDQNQIPLTINKTVGESYNIGLSTSLRLEDKTQLSNIRRALVNNWGVAPEDEVIAENQSANIQIDVVGSTQTVAALKSNFFGASLITHIPAQLLFLLKISLTSILLLMATGLLFSLIPETLFKKEK